MKVRLAKTAGFCMGVRRAMDIVLDAANKPHGPLYTEGPLIHNPQVMELLESRGVKQLASDSALPDATIVVRAHGITPQRRAELKATGARLRDATCPHVARVQAIAKRAAGRGRDVVIVGDAGHSEVLGIQGYANNGGFVIQSADQVDGLPEMEAVCVVAQTTQNRDQYEAIVDRLKARYADCEVHDTICDATADRQAEAVALARWADAMVVVGGKHSANTRRLVELCAATGTPTYHVETEEQLPTDVLRDLGAVGVTAGASTPNWMLARVVERLQSLNVSGQHGIARALGAGLRLLVCTNVYVALGALSLTYANCRLMEVRPHALPWVALLYVLSMQTFNMIVGKKSNSLNDPGRAQFVERHGRGLLAVAMASALAAVAGSWLLGGPAAFGLLLLASALGGIYRVRFMPRLLRQWFGWERLADIPGTREVFLTSAWAVATVLIPALAHARAVEPKLAVALCFAGSMVFLRTLILDIRDIQGDQLMGKETLPVLLGLVRSKVVVVCAVLASVGVMVAAPGLGWTSGLSYALLVCVGYAGAYLWVYHVRLATARLTVECIVDANFLLAGAVALAWG